MEFNFRQEKKRNNSSWKVQGNCWKRRMFTRAGCARWRFFRVSRYAMSKRNENDTGPGIRYDSLNLRRAKSLTQKIFLLLRARGSAPVSTLTPISQRPEDDIGVSMDGDWVGREGEKINNERLGFQMNFKYKQGKITGGGDERAYWVRQTEVGFVVRGTGFGLGRGAK